MPRILKFCIASVLLSLCVFAGGASFAEEQAYDPLKIFGDEEIKFVDLTLRDDARDREIPLRAYLPAKAGPAPVVLFSHGLGGSRKNNRYLADHWAGRGYVVVFMQHPGSDTSVWKDVPRRQRMKSMKEAASGKNFMYRVKDVPAVIDQLEKWNAETGHPLKGRMDLSCLGMSGHSFGAVTTQAVSGQRFGRGRVSFTDPRIKAAVAFSPGSPRRGEPESAFARVKIPWMLMTGTKDEAMIGDQDVESRLAVYPALPPGGKYELVLYNAEHSAFTDRALPGDTEPRNPNHHRAILALTTAFWDAWLKEDAGAAAWLKGDGPKSVLEEKDRWRWK